MFVAVAAFGIADEVYQGFIPGRDPNPLDWIADVAGAAAGVLASAAAMRHAPEPRDTAKMPR